MRPKVIIDGCEAAAHIAYHLSEVIAIYPITPSSNMGELADDWAAHQVKNLWGNVPTVTEMQSEAGAAGAVHGALQAGALSTTFTASQGLLLMIPNMFKIAGELTPAVFHVAARSVATQALSIFGDHSDVMSCRSTGWAMLCAGSVQEVMDLALIAHASTLKARVPFLHFFDGFRTSHELMKVERLGVEEMRQMIDPSLIIAHRNRGLTPDNPSIRGTAQNPDVFFQAREASNIFYLRLPAIVEEMMEKFEVISGRRYRLFDYVGHPEAERVIVMMGSGAEAAHEAVDSIVAGGEKVGLIKVRLFRPFSAEALLSVIPKATKSIAVLDRTKEPGALGEPLYQDVVTALAERVGGATPRVIGGRYGLSSKEFTPAMVKAVYDELQKSEPKKHFTVGIHDDVTNLSLSYDPTFSTENDDSFRGIFIGLGADGTVSANKNSIKIIGEETDNCAQGYFVYDSKKSGSMTRSHLRFGSKAIRSTYLIDRANFIACHQFNFVEKLSILEKAEKGATFLLNSPYAKEEVWNRLPKELQRDILAKEIKFYVIDAYKVARDTGMGNRINTIMQTCFFAISGILSREDAITKIKHTIKKTFGKRGEEVVRKNFEAVDHTLAHLHQVDVPNEISSNFSIPSPVSKNAPEFVRNFIGEILADRGDTLPVSAMQVDGVFPTATAKWEKRNITETIPEWDPNICTQCGKCALVCPHGVIRIGVYDEKYVEGSPETFKKHRPVGPNWPKDALYTIQVSPEDCTGCELCVEVCPARSKANPAKKALQMVLQRPIRESESANWEFFEKIPPYDRTKLKTNVVSEAQMLEPLFEFSGACAGCGETPYLKLVSQLYGDRMLIANATGCSSIYGGNLPTTPWTKNAEGRGPAWANSLFEDNAEFGLGIKLAVETKEAQIRSLLNEFRQEVGTDLVEQLCGASQRDEAGILEQRKLVALLKERVKSQNISRADEILSLADYLVRKSVWIIGGDGWAYDIGYGGLDHVLASGKDVNILLLDTEVYSNTGGQMSKSTPLGAVAKFAAAGKSVGKKDMGLMAMSYGSVYVAQIAFGANEKQTLRAIIEAEQYDGPSLIIAYSHCIAHGYNMQNGLKQQKLAVDCAHWPLYRYDPRLVSQGQNPLCLDSKDPKIPLKDYIYNETRYKMLTIIDPERAKDLEHHAQDFVRRRWSHYKEMAKPIESIKTVGES